MTVIRAFIAISLPQEIHQSLGKVLAGLKGRLPGSAIRWVTADNVHLTLKFLGDVSLANQELLIKMLDAEVGQHVPFEISIGRLGFFPSIHRPRVIWVGIEAPAELYALQRGIEFEMTGLGYEAENRPFSPHLTLGRVSRNASLEDFKKISDELSRFKVGFLGALCVQSVDLYKSDLRPTGAVYTRLYRAVLREKGLTLNKNG